MRDPMPGCLPHMGNRRGAQPIRLRNEDPIDGLRRTFKETMTAVKGGEDSTVKQLLHSLRNFGLSPVGIGGGIFGANLVQLYVDESDPLRRHEL